MPNMSLKKNPMPSQDPNVRNKNFDEVALGYTEEMAIDEAQRCLNCKNPKCVEGCPVNVHIPEFISKVAEGKFDEAFSVITSTNSLPAICGRVCPQENQCEGKCIRGIKGEPVGKGILKAPCGRGARGAGKCPRNPHLYQWAQQKAGPFSPAVKRQGLCKKSLPRRDNPAG